MDDQEGEINSKSQVFHLPMISPNRLFYPKPTNKGAKQSPSNPYKSKPSALASLELSFPTDIPSYQLQQEATPTQRPQLSVRLVKMEEERQKIIKRRKPKTLTTRAEQESPGAKLRSYSQKKVEYTYPQLPIPALEGSALSAPRPPLWQARVNQQENFKKVLVVQKKKPQQTPAYRIQSLLKLAWPDSTTKDIDKFMLDFEDVSTRIRKLKTKKSKISQILASDIHNSLEKVAFLEGKKNEVKTELDSDYQVLRTKHFQQREDEFMQKIRKEISAISKNLLH